MSRPMLRSFLYPVLCCLLMSCEETKKSSKADEGDNKTEKTSSKSTVDDQKTPKAEEEKPTKSDKPDEPPPVEEPAEDAADIGPLGIGAWVSCDWKGLGTMYTAEVTESEDDQITVKYFSDSSSETHEKTSCKPLGEGASNVFEKGTEVTCNWKGFGTFYSGSVVEARGTAVRVRYDSDDSEEVLSTDFCKGVDVANVNMSKFKAGVWVACDWRGFGTIYSAEVTEVAGSQLTVKYFSDSTSETLVATRCTLLGDGKTHSFSEGDLLSCDWKGYGTDYDGTVLEVRGSGLKVLYDSDGSEEVLGANKCKKK